MKRQLKEIAELDKLKQLIPNPRAERATEETASAHSPPRKKRRFGYEYETGDLSDEYNEKDDEVDKYLSMHIDPDQIPNNPLLFWKENQKNLPLMAKLARTIHSIPATTASVEREFSASGLVMCERRSSLNPHNVDNILLLRSATR